MRPIHPRFYTHLVTLWLALSIGGIVLGIVVWQRLNESLDASLRGASFRITLQNVDRSLEEAEAAAKSFGLSADPGDLEQFRADEQLFSKRFSELAILSQQHPELTQDISDLQRVARERFVLLNQQIDLRQKNGLQPLLESGILTRSREVNQRLRAITDRLEQYPQDLLATHSTAARYELQRALSTTLAAGLFGLGAGVLAFYLSRVALRQEKQQRELSEHALRAERAAQEKTTFLANMSHEIRTPMNAILGFSELLVAELPLGGRSRPHARSIYDAARSLLQLINDILDLSKIEASMLELHLDPVDLREMTGFLQTVFSQQASKKGLKLEFNLAPDLPPAVLVDRSRLRQVMVNLVGNAVKFTERGKVAVHIKWKASDANPELGSLTFSVIDTGIGIPPEKQVQIFEPFVQVDTRRPFEQQGTGLGLSIVQQLTERMGGTIKVESALGEGASFHVTLVDVSVSSRRAEVDLNPADEMVDFNRLASAKILVVDDNAVNRRLLGSTFDGTHHQVSFATNGREAVECVRRAKPDIVLMDIRMPEMDGKTALSEIRKIPGAEELPIIAVTASSMIEDEEPLQKIFAGYLRKPFTRPMLFRQLACFLPLGMASAQKVSAPRNSLPIDTKKWQELAAHLRRIEQTELGKVRDSGAITEVKDFAHTLSLLARSHSCPPLADFSAGLSADVGEYAIARIETRLDQFPALVAEIARLSSGTAKPEAGASAPLE